MVKMVKHGKIAPEKSAPECPFECGGGGVIAIWAMPKQRWHLIKRCFPSQASLQIILVLPKLTPPTPDHSFNFHVPSVFVLHQGVSCLVFFVSCDHVDYFSSVRSSLHQFFYQFCHSPSESAHYQLWYNKVYIKDVSQL